MLSSFAATKNAAHRPVMSCFTLPYLSHSPLHAFVQALAQGKDRGNSHHIRQSLCQVNFPFSSPSGIISSFLTYSSHLRQASSCCFCFLVDFASRRACGRLSLSFQPKYTQVNHHSFIVASKGCLLLPSER